MRKPLTIIALLLIIVIGGGEIVLRTCLGMANAPLYDESDEWEYMAKPDQDGVRFMNHYHYNSYSQRSDEPDSTKHIVLGLGDSVLFGGMMIDQDSIATSIFTRENPGWQMLNISAGSWGPDNCAAYLKHYGLFNAEAMFLVVSSHDAHDNINHQKVVGVHDAYPDKQYWCGWAEFICRYIWPRISSKLHFSKMVSADPDQQVLQGTGIMKDGVIFNPGFDQLSQMADSAGIPLYVYLHADMAELMEKKFNAQGEQIIAWAQKNNVTLIKELDYEFGTEDYRDGIHQSKSGQRKMAEIARSIIKQSE